MAQLFVPVQQQDQVFGTFDSVLMIDAAGTEHLVEARYAVTNNNVVSAYYRRRDVRGNTTEQTIQLGPTADINDPAYWKLDSIRAYPRGNDLVLRLAGHQIQDSSPFRRLGQGQTTFVIAGVWAPFISGGDPLTLPVVNAQTFSDVGTDNPFYREIEIVAGLGIMSGYAEQAGVRTFRWGNNLTRGQFAKAIANLLRLLGGQ